MSATGPVLPAIRAPRPLARPALRVAILGASGLALGFTLSMAGFTRFDEVHAMFTFADIRLFLVFIGGAVLTGLGFRAAQARAKALPTKFLHRGTVPGAVLFGLGWAVCGACPGVVFAQLGEGQAHAFAIAIGAALGTMAYRPVHERWLGWDRGR